MADLFPARFLLGFVLAWQLQAQQIPGRLVMSPIPIWDDSAPPNKPGAFFDARHNQLVLLSPGIGATLAEVRYDVPNGTKTSIDFSVQASSKTAISYRYTLTDDAQGRQRAKRVSLLVPASDTTLTFGTSAWLGEFEPTNLPDRSGTAHMGTMKLAAWRDPSSVEAKVSGIALTIQSAYLPGFAQAFVEGQVSNPFTAQALTGITPELSDQAQQLLQPGIGSQSVFVIAPLFPVGTSKAVIAANYHFGVSVLQRGGQISPNSDYARQLLQGLSAFLESGGAIPVALPTSAPASPVESAIQQALALALK